MPALLIRIIREGATIDKTKDFKEDAFATRFKGGHMLRLLIYLVLFAAEQETTETHKRTLSIVGVRTKLEGLLKDTEHFARDDLAFFDLKTFDTTVLKMLEDAELQMNDGILAIPKHSTLRRAAEWHPFLFFVVQHATGIKFDTEAITGKFWKD